MMEQKAKHADQIEKKAIPDHLRRIEQENEVKVLLAGELGSRAWVLSPLTVIGMCALSMFINPNGILR